MTWARPRAQNHNLRPEYNAGEATFDDLSRPAYN
jgi:hypothetical protein